MSKSQKPLPNAKTLRRYSLIAFGAALFWIALMIGLGHTLQESLANQLTISALFTALLIFLQSATRGKEQS